MSTQFAKNSYTKTKFIKILSQSYKELTLYTFLVGNLSMSYKNAYLCKICFVKQVTQKQAIKALDRPYFEVCNVGLQ